MSLATPPDTTFPFIPSTLPLKLNQPQHIANREAWTPILSEYTTNLASTTSEGTRASISRHQSRGQLLARDRVALLLDPDSPWLELCPFAGFTTSHSSPCASLLSGIGLICGRPCLVLAHISTLSSGAWNKYTVLKQNRVTQIATQNALPIVALVQSAGVFLPQQFRVFHRGARIFRDLARRSQKGLASCAVVFGSSTAGGAYHPALSDYTVFVEKQAQVFLGAPFTVKMAIGEEVGAEELGGAEMHGSVTGLADQVARDEFEALRMAREWVGGLGGGENSGAGSPLGLLDQGHVLEPRYPIEDIFSIVDPDIRKPFDMKEVLLRIVDDSRLMMFKPEFGPNLITAWATIHGIKCGIIANAHPVIHTPEALKATQFIRLANTPSQSSPSTPTPLIFLHNVSGFMVGLRAERSRIINAGAQFVSAVSTSQTPHISLIMGCSYGAGNYAMCGRGYKPRFLWSWPTGRCSAMGPQQLAGVMRQVEIGASRNKEKEKARRRAAGGGGAGGGGEQDGDKGGLRSEAEIEERVEGYRQAVERDSSAYRTSGVVLDDGVIDPRDTREVLGMCLEIVVREMMEGNSGKSGGAEAHRGLARL